MKPTVQKLFSELGVLSPEEIQARYEIELGTYVRRREIEARICLDLASNYIIPAGVGYQLKLARNVRELKGILSAAEVKTAAKTQLDYIKRISEKLNTIKDGIEQIKKERIKADKLELEKKADAYCHVIFPIMNEIREAADGLELIVEDEFWPLPKMREILYTR